MFILILPFCLLLAFGLIYWARKSYWVPFGVDFTLIKNGSFRVRTSYIPYFKRGFIFFGVGIALLGLSILFIKPVFPATVLEFLSAVAFLLVVISFLMILIIPFVARLSSAAIVYSDGIDLKPAWDERLFLDAHCIKNVRFAKKDGEFIFVRLHHYDKCKCHENYYENLFRKSLLVGDECKIDCIFSPLSQTVFAQMVASGQIDSKLNEVSDGALDSSWLNMSNEDNQRDVVCDRISCEKTCSENQIIVEARVVQNPGVFVRIGLLSSILIATFFGWHMFVRSELIPLMADILVSPQGLVVRSSYDLYGYRTLKKR